MSVRARASWQHRAFDRALRLIRFRHRYWAKFDGRFKPKPIRLPASVRRGRGTGEEVFQGHLLRWLDPKGRDAEGYVVALHGGGYVAEASPGHLGSYAALADATGMRVYAPHYPLAPFHSPTEMRDWTRDCVEDIRGRHPDDPLLMTGDSAGANLVLQLNETGVRAECILLWSPWLDIAGDNPEILARDGDCALLRGEGMREFAALYHGDEDPRDPLLSPLRRDAEDLPPTLVISGERDLLHSDIVKWFSRRAEQGQPVELISTPNVWHDYMLLPTPEAREAIGVSASFLTKAS